MMTRLILLPMALAQPHPLLIGIATGVFLS